MQFFGDGERGNSPARDPARERGVCTSPSLSLNFDLLFFSFHLPKNRLLADPEIGHFFEAETLPKHKAIVSRFLIGAMGGPNEYKVPFVVVFVFLFSPSFFDFRFFFEREKKLTFFPFFFSFSLLPFAFSSFSNRQGRNMVDAHIGLVDLRYPEDFLIVAGALSSVLGELDVPKQETDDVMSLVGTLEPDFKKIAKFRKMMEEDAE